MESVFGEEDLVTLDAGALAAVPHPRTRAFLGEVGLPNQYGRWLELDESLEEGEVTLVGPEGATRLAAKYPGIPQATASWMTVGSIGYDNVAVDVLDGAVYCIPESGAMPCLLNTGLDELACFLVALEQERPNYDFEAAGDSYDPDAEERLKAVMEGIDPAALASPDSAWHRVLTDVERKLQ
ncbi:hypothetical protein GXW82_09650 [Streptacidiphilus sp. 4-A2]|nr:hypothetical protein [Streptacidiphilus sp. 4-A2]